MKCDIDYFNYAREKIDNGIKEFERKTGYTITKPSITWDVRGIRRAGFARYCDNSIHLNKAFLSSNSWKEFLDVTPLHELAHIISGNVYGERGHGRIWKNVCHELGLKGDRCHHYEQPDVVGIKTYLRKRYTAYCNCREHQLSSVKYNRILRKEQVYICKFCKGVVRLTKDGI